MSYSKTRETSSPVPIAASTRWRAVRRPATPCGRRAERHSTLTLFALELLELCLDRDEDGG